MLFERMRLELASTCGNLMEGITSLRNAGNGRRLYRRYPIDLGIRCRVLRNNQIISGKVCDISSGGVRFISSEILTPGKKVELSIDWPVLLDGACPLQLKFWGRIVRSDKLATAF